MASAYYRSSHDWLQGRLQRAAMSLGAEVEERVRIEQVFRVLVVLAHVDGRVEVGVAARLKRYRHRVRPGVVEEGGQRLDALVAKAVRGIGADDPRQVRALVEDVGSKPGGARQLVEEPLHQLSRLHGGAVDVPAEVVLG